MTKGGAKNKSSGQDILAPPQSRSLRSRKRECPSEGIPETDGANAALPYQDPEGSNTAVGVTQCCQSPSWESTLISTQHQQAAERSHLTEQYMATEEKLAEGDHVSLHNVSVKAVEEQEETVTKPSSDCQVVITDDKADESGMNKEETRAEECNKSPQTCIDLPQVPLPTSEESDGCGSNASEEQMGAKENSESNLERNQETVLEDMEVKEAVVGLPAKKKRRMGMCGLTEKERSHFLKAQKRENEKNEVDRVQKEMCNKTAEAVTQEEEVFTTPLSPCPLSTPAGSITGQSEPEIKVDSRHCGGDGGSESFSEESKATRAETEVHVAVPVLAGTSAGCDRGCSEEKEVKEGIVAGPEETGDTKSDPPAEPECLRTGEPQEPDERTTEILGTKSQDQIKELENRAAEVHQSPAIGVCTIATQNEESEDWDSVAAPLMEVNNVTRTTDEKTEELIGDAEGIDGAEADVSPTNTRSEGFTCAAVGPCEAAVTLSGSERKDTCDPDDGTDGGASTVNAEQTRTSNDPFASGCLDYVSDSQLNTIVLTEEELMEVQEDLGSPHSHEDATDLICGLIRELSSLNRRVMATHREIENLHRGSKSSRSSIR